MRTVLTIFVSNFYSFKWIDPFFVANGIQHVSVYWYTNSVPLWKANQEKKKIFFHKNKDVKWCWKKFSNLFQNNLENTKRLVVFCCFLNIFSYSFFISLYLEDFVFFIFFVLADIQSTYGRIIEWENDFAKWNFLNRRVSSLCK